MPERTDAYTPPVAAAAVQVRHAQEAEGGAAADDIDAHAWCRAARAKVLARRGQFPGRALLDEPQTLLAPTS